MTRPETVLAMSRPPVCQYFIDNCGGSHCMTENKANLALDAYSPAAFVYWLIYRRDPR